MASPDSSSDSDSGDMSSIIDDADDLRRYFHGDADDWPLSEPKYVDGANKIAVAHGLDWHHVRGALAESSYHVKFLRQKKKQLDKTP